MGAPQAPSFFPVDSTEASLLRAKPSPHKFPTYPKFTVYPLDSAHSHSFDKNHVRSLLNTESWASALDSGFRKLWWSMRPCWLVFFFTDYLGDSHPSDLMTTLGEILCFNNSVHPCYSKWWRWRVVQSVGTDQ